MKRVHCLYRVSTKGQVDKDDIPMQRGACRDFANRNDWTILKEYKEKGISGYKVSVNERDAIQDLKKAAEKKEFDVLLVFMFDRIGRIDDETPFVVEWFIKHGIEVRSVNEGQQRMDSHLDKLMNYIRFWQANGESQKTSARVKTRLNQMTMEGRFTGGVAPFGYKLIKSGEVNKKGKELMQIIVDDEEREIIKLIFDKTVKEGIGSYRMAELLNNMGVRTHNSSLFQCNTINRILKNKIYCGYMVSGEVQSECIEELQIIEEDIYNDAQYILKQRSSKNEEKTQIARTTKSKTLLSGNIYCGHCGKKLNATSYTDTYTKADGTKMSPRRERYICTGKAMKRNCCDGQTAYVSTKIDVVAVREILDEYFLKIKSTPKDIALEKRYREEITSLKRRKTNIEKEVQKLKKQTVELSAEIGKSLIGESKFTSDMLSQAIENTNTLLKDKQREFSEIEYKLTNQVNAMGKLDVYYNQFKTWADEFDKSTIEQQKMIVCRLISEIKVKKGYELEVVFDMNYERFVGDKKLL